MPDTEFVREFVRETFGLQKKEKPNEQASVLKPIRERIGAARERIRKVEARLQPPAPFTLPEPTQSSLGKLFREATVGGGVSAKITENIYMGAEEYRQHPEREIDPNKFITHEMVERLLIDRGIEARRAHQWVVASEGRIRDVEARLQPPTLEARTTTLAQSYLDRALAEFPGAAPAKIKAEAISPTEPRSEGYYSDSQTIALAIPRLRGSASGRTLVAHELGHAIHLETEDPVALEERVGAAFEALSDKEKQSFWGAVAAGEGRTDADTMRTHYEGHGPSELIAYASSLYFVGGRRFIPAPLRNILNPLFDAWTSIRAAERRLQPSVRR